MRKPGVMARAIHRWGVRRSRLATRVHGPSRQPIQRNRSPLPSRGRPRCEAASWPSSRSTENAPSRKKASTSSRRSDQRSATFPHAPFLLAKPSCSRMTARRTASIPGSSRRWAAQGGRALPQRRPARAVL